MNVLVLKISNLRVGRSQAGVEDASLALAEAQSSIVDLFTQIRDIKTKAAESEATGLYF